MSLDKLNTTLVREVAALAEEGRAKAEERITVGYVPATGDLGPRYRLQGSEAEFIRMNSNSYLSLSHHAAVLAAADEASRTFGAGPGAVRFIDGTCEPHVELERGIAVFQQATVRQRVQPALANIARQPAGRAGGARGS